MKRHVESVHEDKKSHKCMIYDYSYSRKGNMKAHVELVHENKRDKQCPHCDYARIRPQSSHVWRHVRLKHPTLETPKLDTLL